MDLTQKELAQLVGCSSSLIFKIETDERRPSRQIAELLARQLAIPAEQRELFLKAARQELAAFRLDNPVAQGIEAMPAISHAAPVSSKMLQAAPDPAEEGGLRRAALPVFPTPLIGREHEIDFVAQQVLDPACRLLTLTGPGGVGKTRLAVEVAHRLEPAFRDGVYFLAMAGVDLPESILPVLADAIGLIFSGPADPQLQVVQALRKKNMLLVFDNMEHLVAGSAVLGEILQQVPGLRILLTSREPVHLQWEWVFEVQGLPVPESDDPGLLEANSATALFLQRTRQAARHVPENTANAADRAALIEAAAVIQICRLVDGLPLAIELAASWARVMSPKEIAEELAQGLDLLETTLQDIPARHRSIRLVFDHSWKLLTEEERAALMKLAVFPGGFTREAAQKVAGASVMLLSALVSKSLMRYGKKAGRYDFHELVRQYALKRLSEDVDQELSAFARHAEYYAGWVAGLEWQIKSAQQIQASTRIRAEKSNWSAAWYWSARQQRLDLLRQMETCLYWFYEIHGDNSEAVASIAYAVKELQAAGAPAALTTDAQKATFVLLVDQLGWFEFRTGNVERAMALFTESMALAQSMTEPDKEVLYYIHINVGYMTLITGDLETSRQSTQISLENARALGGQWHAAIAISILGIVEYQRGHLKEAYQQLNDSLKLWREVGDLRGLVFCMLYLSAAALALGDYHTVEAIVGESNAIAHQKLDRWAHAFGLDLLGNVAIARGDIQSAVEHFQRSLMLSQEIGDQMAVTLALIHMGDAQLALGDRAEAQHLFQKAYENARQSGWVSTMLEALVAFLATDDETPVEFRLAITLSVLSNPAVTLTSRQRAERLRDQLSAALTPQQLEAAQNKARQKSAEQWASAFFKHIGAESQRSHEFTWGWTTEAKPV